MGFLVEAKYRNYCIEGNLVPIGIAHKPHVQNMIIFSCWAGINLHQLWGRIYTIAELGCSAIKY